MLGKGLRLLVYDPEVHLSNLLGANRRFIEQHVPHIGSLMRPDIGDVIADSELLIVALNDSQTLELLRQHLREDQVVIDLVGIRDRKHLRADYIGLCW